MNEYQRQAYLDALGVEQYVPRWRLACAPEAMACELPAAVEEVAQTPESAPTSSVVEPAPQRTEPQPTAVAEVLEGMAVRDARHRRAPKKVTIAARPVAPEQVPFKLSIWRSPLPLLVLDAREPKAALPTDRLLRNLLAALGATSGQGITEEVLPWPLIDNPGLRLTAEDARQELHSWLEAELHKRPARHLLLMGENAARYFLPEGQSYEEALWQVQTVPLTGQPVLVAPSLAELLRDTSLKRPLWHALQAWLPMTS